MRQIHGQRACLLCLVCSPRQERFQHLFHLSKTKTSGGRVESWNCVDCSGSATPSLRGGRVHGNEHLHNTTTYSHHCVIGYFDGESDSRVYRIELLHVADAVLGSPWILNDVDLILNSDSSAWAELRSVFCDSPALLTVAGSSLRR